MRKLHHLLASTAVAVLLVAGCDDDEDVDDGTLTASIDGSAFTATTVTGTYASNVLAFSGLGGSGTQILISIPNVTTTGTFDVGIGQAGVAQVVVGTQVWTTALTGGTGSVVITALSSSQASGTFTFTAPASTGGATGTKVVTSGTFTIEF